jgi:hypothetical protein
VAEWAARIVVSYLMCPADGVDITDAVDVRRLVRQFVLPGIRALRVPPGVPAPSTTRSSNSNRTNRTLETNRSTTTKGEAS